MTASAQSGITPPLSRLRLGAILAVLTLANVLSNADRSLLFVLGEPIKRELRLSDTQLGILNGAAFAIVYCALAIPLSRLSDRGLQRRIVAWSLAVWSTMTALGSFAHTFAQFALMRVGVAGGEAGLQPASHALISRLFAPDKRGKAFAVFTLGLPAGVSLAAFAGGWAVSVSGWRLAFEMVGPLGLLLVPLVLVVLPRGLAVRSGSMVSTFTAARTVWADRAFRRLWFGLSFATSFGFGTGAFFVSFYMRSYGLSPGRAAAIFGLVNGGVGVVGTLAGGTVYDRIVRRAAHGAVRPMIIALIASGIAAPCAWLVPSFAASIGLITVSLLLYLFITVPTIASTQAICPPESRATASAMLGMSYGLVGAVMGPLLVGSLSDALGGGTVQGLTRALTAVALLQLVAAAFFASADRDLRRRSGDAALSHRNGRSDGR